jgi:hypothetical protein
MIGPLIEAVKALIEAAEGQAGAILPGAATLTVKATGPGPVLASAPPGGRTGGLLTGLADPLPNPCRLTLSGRVQVGADLANPPKPATLRVGVAFSLAENQVLKSAVDESGPVAADGTWELSTTLFFYEQVSRDTLLGSVGVEPTTVPVQPEKIRIDNARFEWFMDTYDREEAKALAQGLKNRRVFLARVRKVVQRVKAFDFVIGQTANEPALYPATSDMAERWKAADTVVADHVPIRLSHVVAAIEAARKQKPVLALPPGFPDPSRLTDRYVSDLLSWAGDLASAVQTFLWERHYPSLHPGPPAYPTLEGYLADLASYDQLRGDLDGVILGDRYDPTRALTANLRGYYGSDSRKRYSLFVDTERDSDGNLPIRLKPGSPPRLTAAARDYVAAAVSVSTRLLLFGALLKAHATGLPVPAAVDAAVDAGSSQMLTTVKYFADFLEAGLAAE